MKDLYFGTKLTDLSSTIQVSVIFKKYIRKFISYSLDLISFNLEIKHVILLLDIISMKFDKIWNIFELVIHNNMKKVKQDFVIPT